MRLIRATAVATLFLVIPLLNSTVDGGGKDKKFDVPKNAISAIIISVNQKKASFTVTTATGVQRIFRVDAETQFWGPKGGDRGTGPKGLKDVCMAPNYEIKIVLRKDGKTAKDVFLPERKGK